MTNEVGFPGPLDAMAAAHDHHRVLLENQRVRVLDTRLAPGDTTPVHEHGWPAVLPVLSWSDFVRIDREEFLGDRHERPLRDGQYGTSKDEVDFDFDPQSVVFDEQFDVIAAF